MLATSDIPKTAFIYLMRFYCGFYINMTSVGNLATLVCARFKIYNQCLQLTQQSGILESTKGGLT